MLYVQSMLCYVMLYHGLLIEYGRICHIVKMPISMIRPFSLVNNLILYRPFTRWLVMALILPTGVN